MKSSLLRPGMTRDVISFEKMNSIRENTIDNKLTKRNDFITKYFSRFLFSSFTFL